MKEATSQPVNVSKKTARKLILAAHYLYPPRKLKGKKGILTFFQKVRSVQFDPINVVGRNPDLVMQSRIGDYLPAMLDELLYQDRVLVDNWDKMASLSLTEDWPYFSRHRSRMEDIFGVPSEVVMTLAPDVINQIKKEGPQSSLDFKHEQKTDWSWGPTRVSRAALEGLYKMGQLGVHHRVNNRRYFDLIENLLPEEILSTADPNSTFDEYQAWHVLRRIAGLGLAHPNAGEHWGGMIGVKSSQRKKILHHLLELGDVVPVEIDELPGELFYLQKKDLGLLEKLSNQKAGQQAAFIAPLDNMLWDRKSIRRIFDFTYIWEVYKPKKDRQYGYYVLPVLFGDQFIARFDPSFDKKNQQLTINNWWWEDGFQPTKESSNALEECMQDFLTYLNAGELLFSPRILEKGGLSWLENLT